MHCEASNMTSSVEEYWDRYVLSHVGHDWTSYVSCTQQHQRKSIIFGAKNSMKISLH